MIRHRRFGSVSTLALAALALWLVSPALAQGNRIEKSLDLQPGGAFVLEADAGSVSLRGTDRSGARIVVTSKDEDLASRFDFVFESTARQALVRATRKSSLTSWWGTSSKLHFEIEVPRETALTLSTGGGSIAIANTTGRAELATSGGSLDIEGLEGDLEGRTSGGSIEVSDVRGAVNVRTSGGGIEVFSVTGAVEARTSGGSIEMQTIGGNLIAMTSGGSIRIREAAGRVDAKTSGGSIQVRFGAGNTQGGDIRTSAGGVAVEVDPAAKLTIDLGTSAGSVTSDLPLTVQGTASRTRLSGTLNGGGNTLTARTSAGSVTLGAR